MDDVDELTALVPGAHRVIRRLEDSAALPGDLVSDGDRQRVSADADGLDEALWRYAGAEHVAGVRDVLRTRDGQRVLLPWCADALDAVLARRATAERTLAPGEIVTLVGSLLRGIIEVAGDDAHGRWWLDDECRPLFVPGEGTGCASASVEIIERVRRDCTDRAMERLLRRVVEGAPDHRVVRLSLDEWERELTELAAPRPIDVAVYAPELVRELPVHRARVPQELQRVDDRPSRRERIEALRLRTTERVGAMRDRLRRAVPGERAREKPVEGGRPPRRRMLLVGAAAAGVVLVGGLLWPTGGEDSTAMDAAAVETVPHVPTPQPSTAHPSTVNTPAASASPTTEPTEAPKKPQDADAGGGTIEETVAGLLARIDTCRAKKDAQCAAAIVPGAGGIQERLGTGGAARDLALIEDYGDIAVVRLGRTDEHGEQMVVIVRQKDEWLVRDVYDVADQPSEKG
jgi:hypothetical protein